MSEFGEHKRAAGPEKAVARLRKLSVYAKSSGVNIDVAALYAENVAGGLEALAEQELGLCAGGSMDVIGVLGKVWRRETEGYCVLYYVGSATVNFMRNFRALSKSVEFHPCASAQGREGKEDGGGGGEGGREGKPSPGHDRYAAFFLRPTLAFCFVDSGSGIGVKPGSRAILFNSDSSLRMVGTIAHLCGWPSARFLW